jgi:hypothetical protein
MKDEPVNILDEDGNPTGQILMKSEAHAQSPEQLPLSHEHTEFVWVDKSALNDLDLFKADKAAIERFHAA